MFSIRWKDSALNELADLWMNADSEARKAITAATHQIDQILEQNPQTQGESREGSVRILFVFPLAIRFEVDEQKAAVYVLQVWNYGKK